jgi:ABC-type multidrug transport system fused ATPase/permease subunit
VNKKTFKEITCVLNKQQTIKLVGLGFMILIGGILETLGVGSVLPLVQTIVNADAMKQNKWVIKIMNFFNISDMTHFTILLLITVILVFAVKNVFLLLLSYVQAKYVNDNQQKVGSYMLEEYLNRPYEFYLNADIPTIFRILDGDIPSVFTLLMAMISMVTEIVVTVCLFAVVFLIDYKMTLFMMSMLLIMTLIITKVLKPRLNKLGEERIDIQSRSGRWRTKAMYGIKDVKVLGHEHFFADYYSRLTKQGVKVSVGYSVLNNAPAKIIETTSIGGILLYIAICMSNGVSAASLLPQITAFGVAAVRLIPSINRINTQMTNIAYCQPSLDYVYENVDFTKYKQAGRYVPDAPKNATPIVVDDDIRLKDVSYRYPNTEKMILDHADMTVPIGKSVGVVGPSGAGKSTAIDIFLGLLRPQEGRVECRDRDVMDNYRSWLSHIGYIPQTIYLSDDSIRDNIAFGVPEEEIDDDRIWQVLKEAQMEEFVKKLPDGLDTSTGDRGIRISGGERQRLGIARALYHNPDVLVFDEATSALDNATEKAVMEAIDSFHGKKTMLIIAHRLNTIENCDYIYKVENGKITLEKDNSVDKKEESGKV